jgi:ketosteroid isomerase-like protein
MLQENVEIVRAWIDAFNRGGIEETMRYLDPDIEWTTAVTNLKAGTYHGHEGVRQWMQAAFADWDSLRVEPERFIDAAEQQVVVPLRITALGKQTGTSTVFNFTTVAELQRGMVVRVRNYTNQAEALEAAGLRE